MGRTFLKLEVFPSRIMEQISLKDEAGKSETDLSPESRCPLIQVCAFKKSQVFP